MAVSHREVPRRIGRWAEAAPREWRRRPATVLLVAVILAQLGLALGPSAAPALPPPVLIGYVPLPAQDLANTFETINSAADTSTITFVVGIANAATGAILVYDHWEDGYEADPTSPTQASTLVLGDGIVGNGDAADYCANPAACAGDVLPGGAVLVFRNNIAIPRNPSVIRFDGRDKITSTRAFAITATGFPISPGSLFADAVATYDTTRFGTSFVVPIGQNTPTPVGVSPAFEYTGVSIMAAENGTVVQVDADANGSFDLTQTLNEGEAMHVNGGILQGARIKATKPVQVAVLTGDKGANWEARFFELFPTVLLSNDYLNPVGSPEANQETILYLWNPNAAAITVTPTCTGCAGTISLAANSGASFKVPLGQGVHLTSGGPTFLAIGAVGAQSGAGSLTDGTQIHDWGFSLVPTTVLTWQAVVGYAPGDSALPPTHANWSPVWITTLTNTTLYVKYDGDITAGPNSTPAGCPFPKYDVAIPVTALASTRIDDPSDSDMTGARIFTCDFTKIAGAWGQDPSTADPASTAFDAGWTLFPTTWIVADKTAALATDVNGDGFFGPGDTIQYAVKIANAGFADLTNIVMTDTLPVGVDYVPNSSELVQGMVITPIPDAGITPFPFDEGGALLPDLMPGESYIVRFKTVIKDPYAGPPDQLLVNTVDVTSDQDSAVDKVDTPVVLPPLPGSGGKYSGTDAFYFKKKGVADDTAGLVIEFKLVPGQSISPTTETVTIELSEAACGGTFSRLVIPAGSFTLRSVSAQVSYFTGKITDTITGATPQLSVRIAPISVGGPNYRMSIDLKNEKYTCLEGTTPRKVRTDVFIGNDTVTAEACFQRISKGDLYWPPTKTTICP